MVDAEATCSVPAEFRSESFTFLGGVKDDDGSDESLFLEDKESIVPDSIVLSIDGHD